MAEPACTSGDALDEVLEEVQLKEVQPTEIVQLGEFLEDVREEVQLDEVPSEVLVDVLEEVLNEVQLGDSRTYSNVYMKNYVMEYSSRKYSKKQRPILSCTKEGRTPMVKGEGMASLRRIFLSCAEEGKDNHGEGHLSLPSPNHVPPLILQFLNMQGSSNRLDLE